MKPLIWRELTTEVDAGFVITSALRLERDPGIARGDKERRVLPRHVTTASERLTTCRAARILLFPDLVHAYTVGVGDGRDHKSEASALGTPGI